MTTRSHDDPAPPDDACGSPTCARCHPGTAPLPDTIPASWTEPRTTDPKDITQHGRWVAPGVFEFNAPIEMGEGRVMKRLNLQNYFPTDADIDPSDIIATMVNTIDPIRAFLSDENLIRVTCTQCGGTGYVPESACPDGQPPAGLTCHNCRNPE